MTDTIALIDSIRKVYDEKGYSINKMESLLAENGKEGSVSHSTIARFFSKDKRSEYNYKYNDTIRPLAEVLLDVDRIEKTDDVETQAMKTFVHLKGSKIDKLESALEEEKQKRHDIVEKLKAEHKSEILRLREQHDLETKMLREQIAFKDKRLDQFIDAMFTKDKKIDEQGEQIKELTQKLINCENCKKVSQK
ncbi:MAG: hypothetical protein J5504_08365 [Butyrivibrio sp.]|nr:hypothetical protein [Butyrivibrio sp.]